MRRVVELIRLALIWRRHAGLVGGWTSSGVLVRLGVRKGLLGILLTWLRHLHLKLLIGSLSSQLKVGWREDVVQQVIRNLLSLQVVLLNLRGYTSLLNHAAGKLDSLV